ncbi:aldehyde-activating protein [Rathayibacter rathayi]|nr:aldehyde-activating protein [Rathayibacter rathayi]PPG98748.1 aldehyde-activating protein [Rathayibacter rathayi]
MSIQGKSVVAPETSRPEYIWISGSCHCGKVAFEVALTRSVTVTLCNCRICYMSGHEEIMVPDNRFRVLQGREYLQEYRFGTMTADHTFCRVCGIMPFYRPRSHPVGFHSVNARCLKEGNAVLTRRGDEIDLEFGATLTYVQFDGQNWEASIAASQHKVTD